MICRDGMVGVAGRAASTKAHQPPLQNVSVVVLVIMLFPQQASNDNVK